MSNNYNFCICICTYQRSQLVSNLIDDLFKQTLVPAYLIVVDGDPNSGEVRNMLQRKNCPANCQIYYLPSNHGNLAYQRYLGWRAAHMRDVNYLLYLDDDLRIYQPDTLETLISPMVRDIEVVGITAKPETGDVQEKFAEHPVLLDRDNADKTPALARWFGASRLTPPGGLTPFGERCPPVDSGDGYGSVEWLHGRVMLYRMTALGDDIFSEDLFAITHIHCGMGEDTFLSHRVSHRGKMLLSFHSNFLHPHDALPNSYPIRAKKLGYAVAYSRRLLNDYYRGAPPSPRFSDRTTLIKSYLGNIYFAWWNSILRPASHRFAYAWGYTLGAIRGMFQKPIAKKLTPNINWRQDAEQALGKQVKIL